MLLLLSRVPLAIKAKRFHGIEVDVLKVRQKRIRLQVVLLAVVILLLVHGLPLHVVEITDGVLRHEPLLLQVSDHFLEVEILISEAVDLLVQVVERRLVLSGYLFEVACLVLVELSHALLVARLHDLHLGPDLLEFTRLLLEPILELSDFVSAVLHIFIFHAYLSAELPYLLLILRLNLFRTIIGFIVILFVREF